jgi:hypothetical protein
MYVEKKVAYSRSIIMAKRKGKGFVEGHDAGVGKGDFANMPREVMMKAYPKPVNGVYGSMDDSIVGIDDVMDGSYRKTKSRLSNQK